MREIASASVRSTWRDHLLADVLGLAIVTACVIWLPPLAGAVLGSALGAQLALFQWQKQSSDAKDLNRLTPLVRDLVRTRPGLVNKVVQGVS